MEEVTKFIDSQSHLVTELDGMIGFAVAVTGKEWLEDDVVPEPEPPPEEPEEDSDKKKKKKK